MRRISELGKDGVEAPKPKKSSDRDWSKTGKGFLWVVALVSSFLFIVKPLYVNYPYEWMQASKSQVANTPRPIPDVTHIVRKGQPVTITVPAWYYFDLFRKCEETQLTKEQRGSTLHLILRTKPGVDSTIVTSRVYSERDRPSGQHTRSECE